MAPIAGLQVNVISADTMTMCTARYQVIQENCLWIYNAHYQIYANDMIIGGYLFHIKQL